MKTGWGTTVEVASKPSIASKIEAGRRFQPEEYMEYFEDWILLPNKDIGREGWF